VVLKAVGPDFPLFFDTGLRSGEDVVKAYGQGANFTFLGRVLQFAIAAGGEAGLNQLWSVLRDETSITLAQIGLTSLGDCADQNPVLQDERSSIDLP
jgi:(S)-mandelate dehydrogenase